jgi:hypothetical protein
MESPREIEISISITRWGILVDPPAPELEPTDILVWTCNHPFAIQFKTQSPANEVRHKSGENRGGVFHSDPLTVRDGAHPGVYPYMVAVAELGPDTRTVIQVHMYGSPDIIIRRSA